MTAEKVFPNETAAECFIEYWQDALIGGQLTRTGNVLTFTGEWKERQEFIKASSVFIFAADCAEEIAKNDRYPESEHQ